LFASGAIIYSYVGGNPVNKIDPLGLTPEGAAIGGAIGGGVGGVIGGLVGGGGGTLVAPGVGTIGGGIAGAGEGAVNVAVIGAVIGDIVSDAIKGKAAANDDTYEQCGPDDGDPCDEILKELQELRNDILNDYISGLTTELELEKLRRLFNEQVIDFRKQCPRQGQQLDLL